MDLWQADHKKKQLWRYFEEKSKGISNRFTLASVNWI